MACELASKINLPNSCSSFSETRARMALAYVAGLEVPNGLLGCSLSKASALTCINAAISTISRVILGGMSLDLLLLPLSNGLVLNPRPYRPRNKLRSASLNHTSWDTYCRRSKRRVFHRTIVARLVT